MPSTDTFKSLLGKLVKTPNEFTPDDLEIAFELLFTPDVVPPTQIGAFLAAMHIQKIERRPEILAVAAESLRSRAHTAVVEGADKDFIVDIVGTGGDGHDTFNVSTTAAIVAAGAGARVVKHGARASTSSSGSADLLESIGCVFSVPSPNTPFPIPRIPFTFLFAPHFHPSLVLVAPHRKSLPFRTIFNLIGPLVNPGSPRGMVLGVANPALGRPFAESLRRNGVSRAFVVCGKEGLDEISCAGETWVWELGKDGEIRERVVHPAEFGLRTHPLQAVKGGNAAANSETLKRVLRAHGDEGGEELEPVVEWVLMNASALLVVAGLAGDFKEGVRLARESVESGRAWQALEAFRDTGRAQSVDQAK